MSQDRLLLRVLADRLLERSHVCRQRSHASVVDVEFGVLWIRLLEF